MPVFSSAVIALFCDFLIELARNVLHRVKGGDSI
ncbi:MAG: hypothetical protein [Microvirus sp.]|nr:MAG: hypothetical protein [Microvirus sp.]